MSVRRIGFAFFLLGAAACNEVSSIDNPDPAELDDIEFARMRLGHRLFFDPGLSASGETSCSTCHEPEQFGGDGLATSLGDAGTHVRRNAPSVFNGALKSRQFWDGRAETLEEQALGPLLAPDEMGGTEASILAHVERYDDLFEAAFPGEEGPTLDQVATALADYQRMLPRRSRFDAYLDGNRRALSRTERRGYRLFRRNCDFCHGGAGIGGGQIEKLGEEVAWPEDKRHDQGRFEVTGDPGDRMKFVVPSLRNVSKTAPYFHDGSVETLEDAVRLMGRHQLGRNFSSRNVRALVAFLKTLDAQDVQPWAYADWNGER